MNKARRLLLVLLIMALVLVAGQSDVSLISAARARGRITITIMDTLVTEKEAPLVRAMAEAYMKENPNVRIEFIGTPVNEMAKKIIALNTSGDLPDAFFMPNEFMSTAYDMGIIVDHEKLLGEEWLSTLADYVVEHSKIEDQLMLVPWHVIPVALVYRADWLEEEGFDKIETIEDFRNVAKAFTKDLNGDGTIDRWGFSMVGTRNGSGEQRFTNFIRTFGVNEVYRDRNGKWQTDLTTDKFRKALQTFVDLALVDGVVPPGPTVTGYPEAAAFFAQEKTGLMITGSNAIGAIESDNPSLKGKLASCPLPRDERHVTNLQVSGLAITTASKHPEVVADFLKFITKKEIAIEFAKQSGRLPVTKEALADELFQKDPYKGFIDCMKYAIAQPAFPGYTELLDIMGEAYSVMIGNNVPLNRAMVTVESRVKDLLAEHNK